mmetsp:Transcript_14898/g.44915  ORF Transcript_14898/g.44915 Transcript_14898/m.44915 type:complete len:380 (+) Transcript_14898:1431-2570(+)
MLLNHGHVLDVHLHAQVAAGHHDGIRRLDDAGEVLDGAGLLELGDDLGLVLARVLHDLAAQQLHVLGQLHEAQRDVVRVVVQDEVQVQLVLRGHGGDGQHHVGRVHALAARDGARHRHLALDPVGAGLDDAHDDLPVVDEQRLARLERLQDLGVRQLHAAGVALLVVEVEAELVAHRELELGVVLEHAAALLGALEVGEHADGVVVLLLDLADDLGDLALLLAAVAQVEAEDVRAGLEELLDHVLPEGLRPQARDLLHVLIVRADVRAVGRLLGQLLDQRLLGHLARRELVAPSGPGRGGAQRQPPETHGELARARQRQGQHHGAEEHHRTRRTSEDRSLPLALRAALVLVWGGGCGCARQNKATERGKRAQGRRRRAV